MQAHPGHQVDAAHPVLVEWLMHVPDKANGKMFSHKAILFSTDQVKSMLPNTVTTSLWISLLVAKMCPVGMSRGPSCKSETRPPASSTIKLPAAISQGESFISQKPSNLPLAT